jgi:hypothetical protein
MAVYQAAVERFELQMEVLEEYRASTSWKLSLK